MAKKIPQPETLFDSPESVNWNKALKPLFRKYQDHHHPLKYQSLYQLMIMVILSARDSDKHINMIAPALFEKFPSMEQLSAANVQDITPFIKDVSNFANKAEWITGIAHEIKDDKNISLTMEGLTNLKGIGRKSANVIMTEIGAEMEGVIVDLHTIRVAPRLGIAQGTTPEKIEKQLMQKVNAESWRILGMSLTYLGRETCRPTNPKCDECVMNSVCGFNSKTMK